MKTVNYGVVRVIRKGDEVFLPYHSESADYPSKVFTSEKKALTESMHWVAMFNPNHALIRKDGPHIW